MPTPADLAVRVLKELAIIASDETPSAADAEDVKAVYRRIVQEYEYAGDVAIDPEVIPDAVFEPLALCTAARCAAMFGKVSAIPEDVARMMLRRVTAKQYTGATAQITSF